MNITEEDILTYRKWVLEYCIEHDIHDGNETQDQLKELMMKVKELNENKVDTVSFRCGAIVFMTITETKESLERLLKKY